MAKQIVQDFTLFKKGQGNLAVPPLSQQTQKTAAETQLLIISAKSICGPLMIELSKLTLPCKIVGYNSPCYCHLLTG